jgi:GTPase
VEARQELRQMLDTDVYLDLHVTVQKNWRSDEQFMRRLGYRVAKEKE